jgi:DNA-binding XRE family transcriptional regulator
LDRREEKRAASASERRDESAKRAEKRSEAHHAGHESDSQRSDSGAKPSSAKRARGKNNVRKLRMERMMSKAELARRAGLSTLTIDRVEQGMTCRMDTKRKILEALGLTPSDRVKVFGDDD